MVHRRNRISGATVLYRDRGRIRVFTSEGVARHEGWRKRSSELRCGKVTVRNIDRIVIRMKALARRTLVIDQSGRGLKRRPRSRTEFRGPGGFFTPGASGRGIRVEFANEPRRRSFLIYAGSDRSERVYLSRESGLTSLRLRSAAGRARGSLIGFNARQIHLKLNGGGDLMEARGLGPDPNDYGAFFFEVFGGNGNDRLLGHQGRDLMMDGGPGDDLIKGRRGDDRDIGIGYGLFGGAGDDTILGGPGDDLIEGESGQDLVLPGPGKDEIFMKDGEHDVINCEFNVPDFLALDNLLDELIDCPDDK